MKRIFKVCIELWINGSAETLKASGSTIRVLIEDCIGPATDPTYHPTISVLFNLVTQCLSYQYKNAFPQVLHTLSTFFKVLVIFIIFFIRKRILILLLILGLW